MSVISEQAIDDTFGTDTEWDVSVDPDEAAGFAGHDVHRPANG